MGDTFSAQSRLAADIFRRGMCDQPVCVDLHPCSEAVFPVDLGWVACATLAWPGFQKQLLLAVKPVSWKAFVFSSHLLVCVP